VEIGAKIMVPVVGPMVISGMIEKEISPRQLGVGTFGQPEDK